MAGGPSASGHIHKLEGRNVIAVNSSWVAAPFAQYLFYADARWWNQFGRDVARKFRGKIVTTSRHNQSALRVEKKPPPEVKHDQHTVTMSRTSLAGAICLAAKLGARPIVLLGADGQILNGVRHNHGVEYPWPLKDDSFGAQRAELKSMVPGLRAIGASVVNASPGTTFDAFPVVDLDTVLGDPAIAVSTAGVPKVAPVFKFDRSGEAFDRFVAAKPGTVLDVGSGLAEYAKAMRTLGSKVTTCDIEHPADIHADFMADGILDGPLTHQWFDGVWVSHVLEHQLNVNRFLQKIRRVTRPGGLVAVTVPPLKHQIVGGHVTLWNAGLLLYNLILAGFDCCEARVGTYGYNISVLVNRVDAELPKLKYDGGDIEALAKFFPTRARQGFDGQLKNIRW